MLLVVHEQTNALESSEVSLLRRKHRRPPKVRQHPANQVANVPDLELESLVGSIRPDGTAPPRVLEQVEQLGSFSVLADRDTRSHLPSEAMSLARVEGNAKTTFAVHVA